VWHVLVRKVASSCPKGKKSTRRPTHPTPTRHPTRRTPPPTEPAPTVINRPTRPVTINHPARAVYLRTPAQSAREPVDFQSMTVGAEVLQNQWLLPALQDDSGVEPLALTLGLAMRSDPRISLSSDRNRRWPPFFEDRPMRVLACRRSDAGD
jgi:hypothetical protein